jgi:hypothetical protein
MVKQKAAAVDREKAGLQHGVGPAGPKRRCDTVCEPDFFES